MTTSVVTVDRITPYQEIDRAADRAQDQRRAGADDGPAVAGVVSEADLLAAEDETARQARMASAIGRRWRLRKQPHVNLTAGALMTAPAITIGPDATIPAAARLMNTHHVRRLPVIDEDGKLVGIVSRRDLLSVFLRPDADIVHDVRQVLDEIAVADPEDVIVTVRHGVVTARRDDAARVRPGAGSHPARAPADLGYRRSSRRREQARRGDGPQAGENSLTGNHRSPHWPG